VEETAFFQANGVIVVLWGRDKLAPDMGIDDDGARWSGASPPTGPAPYFQ